MPSDRSDAVVLTLRYRGGRGQRFEIEPYAGDEGTHLVTERTLLRGGTWKFAGEQMATEVALDDAAPLADGGREAAALDHARDHLRALIETADTDAAFHGRHALQWLDYLEAER